MMTLLAAAKETAPSFYAYCRWFGLFFTPFGVFFFLAGRGLEKESGRKLDGRAGSVPAMGKIFPPFGAVAGLIGLFGLWVLHR